MSNFKVGERVDVIPVGRFLNGAEFYCGEEVVIESKLQPSPCLGGALGHRVRHADGQSLVFQPCALRRKPPWPEVKRIARWVDCPWQPEKERA